MHLFKVTMKENGWSDLVGIHRGNTATEVLERVCSGISAMGGIQGIRIAVIPADKRQFRFQFGDGAGGIGAIPRERVADLLRAARSRFRGNVRKLKRRGYFIEDSKLTLYFHA